MAAPFRVTASGVEVGDLRESIRQSVHAILNTRPGERVNRPSFGCAIWEYLFETPEVARVGIRDAVRTALSRFEPRIVVTSVRVEPSNALSLGATGYTVDIDYRIAGLSGVESTSLDLSGESS